MEMTVSFGQNIQCAVEMHRTVEMMGKVSTAIDNFVVASE